MRALSSSCAIVLVLLGITFPADGSKASKRGSRKPTLNKASVPKSQSGILYGRDFAYTLSAPNGWIMDDATGRAQGMSAVFYRRGESWENGTAVMYANVAGKEKGKDDTLDKVIRFDIEQTKEHNPDTKAELVEPLETGDGREAVVYRFSMKGTGAAREQLAYIDTPKVVIMLAMTARSEAAYTKAVPDFVSLVHSFAFVTGGVNMTYGLEPTPIYRLWRKAHSVHWCDNLTFSCYNSGDAHPHSHHFLAACPGASTGAQRDDDGVQCRL